MQVTDYSTPIIAIITFLWYRKRRLWNFYSTFLSKCLDQMKKGSIDKKRWEQIAREQCSLLSQELFNHLFRFEMEYLQHKIPSEIDKLWISDGGSDGKKTYEYYDKEAYCKRTLEQMLLSDFSFCGFGLFWKAIKYKIREGNDKDPGYTEKEIKRSDVD